MKAGAGTRDQEDLLALLDHELRTPLAALDASLDVMERVPPGSSEAVYAMQVARRQSRRAAALLDALLELRRFLAAGGMGEGSSDVAAVAQAAVLALGARNRLDPGLVKIDCGGRHAPVQPRVLGLLLGGLLARAAKAWPGEGLRITAACRNEGLEVLVEPAPDAEWHAMPEAAAPVDPPLPQLGAALGQGLLSRVAALADAAITEPANGRRAVVLTLGGTGRYTGRAEPGQ